MKNELQVFVSVIDVIMHGLSQKTKIDKLETVKLPIVLNHEKKVMEQAFQDFLLNQHDKYHLIRLTKKYHDTIVNLSNAAYAAIPDIFEDFKSKVAQSPAIRELYLVILRILEELLKSIEKESSHFLEETLITSNYFADLHGHNLQLNFLQLQAQWVVLPIETGLVNLLHTYFFSFFGEGTTKCSYRGIKYAENLMAKLLVTGDVDTVVKWINHIWHQLIRYNFNKTEILDYAKFRIAQHSKAYSNHVKSYRFVLLTLKNIRQIAVNANWQYTSTDISLKAYLELILLEELSWLEKNHPHLIEHYYITDQSRIRMNSSKEEINLFTILSIKLKKIENDDPEKVMDILNQFVAISGPNDMPEYHFKNNFSDIDFETVKKYEQHLIKSQRQLRTEYPKLDELN